MPRLSPVAWTEHRRASQPPMAGAATPSPLAIAIDPALSSLPALECLGRTCAFECPTFACPRRIS